MFLNDPFSSDRSSCDPVSRCSVIGSTRTCGTISSKNFRLRKFSKREGLVFRSIFFSAKSRVLCIGVSVLEFSVLESVTLFLLRYEGLKCSPFHTGSPAFLADSLHVVPDKDLHKAAGRGRE